MRDTERLNLVRERLTGAQLALRELSLGIAHDSADDMMNAAQKLEAWFGLIEDAAACPVTPAALFE